MPASYRSVSSNTHTALDDGSYTVTKPSGAAAGDILIACQTVRFGSMNDMGTPTGGATWQLLAQRVTSGELGTKIWWKIAGGSEPSSYVFTQELVDGACVIVAVQDAKQETPQITQNGGTSDSPVVTPTITPTGSDDLDIRWACGAGDVFEEMENATWTPPAGWTQRAQVGQGDVFGVGGALATRSLSSSSATGTQNYVVDMLLTSWHGFAITIASMPPPGGRPPVIPTAAVHRAASW